MQKQELRNKYKNLRTSLSFVEIEEKSLAIANQLLTLPIWDFNFYHLFLSIEKHREINTEYLLHILSGKDKNVVVSKSDFATSEMQHFLLTDSTSLRVNKYGIPEPVNGIEILPQQLDVIFLPLLAFDKKGHRIGYGKGFYDRFLAKSKPETLKIGLSFFEAEKENFKILPTDIQMDVCVTPNKIYRF